MGKDQDAVITVVMEVGKAIMVHAKGEPARTVSYALVAGGAMVATAIAYGGFRYGTKAIDWMTGES